jgi:hypothetical protein
MARAGVTTYGEDIYSGLLESLLRDTFTALEWEGFKPFIKH